MTMEKRLLLFFVLMVGVLAISQYFNPAPAPANKTGAAKSEQAKPEQAKSEAKPDQSQNGSASGQSNTAAAKPGESAANVKASSAKSAEISGQVQGEKEETTTVDTDVFRVVFSNKGAVARNWLVKKFKDRDGKPLELMNEKALGKVSAPFAIAFKGTSPSTDPNNALFKLDRSADGNELVFQYSDGRTLTKKSFRFQKDSYLVAITSEVTQNGVLLPHSLTWRGGFGDATVINPTAVQHALYYDQAAQKLQVKQAKDAKDGPISATGQFSFAGLEDSYFAAVFLPGTKPSIEHTTYSDNIPNEKGADEQRVGAGVGGDGSNSLSLFVGPKDTDLMAKINPKLTQVIDWGWFWFLAEPLFRVLNWTADNVVHNYGWAIVLITVVINLLLFPLRISSMKSSKKMQSLQPQIKAINERYANIPMRDPRQSEKNAEIMELYKKNDVNPVGGCLPMVVQLPFLWAFYKVLSVAIEMRGASWLWATDLSQPDTVFGIHWLPVVLVITQFITQKMTPSPGMDPAQQKMMLFMPLMFGYMFYFASSGLVLYWLTGNVVGIGLQWVLNKLTPTPAPVTVIPAPKKKGR
ncbi:MAG: membrane protein insertase YidC [Bryobacteraceae bacterium]